MSDGGKITMTKTSLKRLQKDIIELIKNPLTDQGIYYAHDENNMLQGYAVVFGPSDTLYRYGAYFFKFSFPSDYPFKPPKVTYMTNDGYTRFHPNLYRNGKVCLSVLNTWKGEGWTSCQTIRSILLTLVTLFHNKPLLNEPGVKETSSSFKPYNKIIRYKNIEVAIMNSLKSKNIDQYCKSFLPFHHNYIKKNKKDILEYLELCLKNEPTKECISTCIYSMSCTIDYKKLNSQIKEAINNI